MTVVTGARIDVGGVYNNIRFSEVMLKQEVVRITNIGIRIGCTWTNR